jgi:hypothetical protein
MIAHLAVRQIPVGLRLRFGFPCAVDSVKLAERRLGPNDKATEMATRRQLEQIHAIDLHEIHTGNVAEGALDAVVLLS